VKTDSGSDYNNSVMGHFLAMLVHIGYCQKVYYLHLVSGHTHDKNDQSYGVVTLYIRQHTARTMGEFINHLQDAFPKMKVVVHVIEDVPDFKAMLHSAPPGSTPIMRQGKNALKMRYAFPYFVASLTISLTRCTCH
jgi:hypothetical protein